MDRSARAADFGKRGRYPEYTSAPPADGGDGRDSSHTRETRVGFQICAQRPSADDSRQAGQAGADWVVGHGAPAARPAPVTNEQTSGCLTAPFQVPRGIEA